MFLILETSLTQKVNLQYEFVENDHEHRVPVADKNFFPFQNNSKCFFE